MPSTPGSSALVYLELDYDSDQVTIIPQDGGVYTYNIDEVSDDVIDKLIESGDYTIYSQGETLTKEEYESIHRPIRGLEEK